MRTSGAPASTQSGLTRQRIKMAVAAIARAQLRLVAGQGPAVKKPALWARLTAAAKIKPSVVAARASRAARTAGLSPKRASSRRRAP